MNYTEKLRLDCITSDKQNQIILKRSLRQAAILIYANCSGSINID